MNVAVPRAAGGAAPYRLLGISGSLRSRSYSTLLLEGLAAAAPPSTVWAYADIGALPHFDQDIYVEPLPAPVQHLRGQIACADGVVISSSEYNHGVPGVLKNALDWASRPHNASPFRGKPVLIVTSSPAFTGGVRAQYQIRETLASMLARPVATPEIVVGGVHTRIVEGRFEDQATLDFAANGFAAMFDDLARKAVPAADPQG